MPKGLADGTIAAIGDYDECMNSVALGSDNREIFRGKYCFLQFRPPLPPKTEKLWSWNPVVNLKHTQLEGTLYEELAKKAHPLYYFWFRSAICVPSTCTSDELSILVEKSKIIFGPNVAFN